MIQKILNTEEANYSSNLDADSLKKRIEKLFKKRDLRLSGKLTSEDEFTAYDNLTVIGWSMPNLRRKSAYLVGKITKRQGGTLVNLKVNPNSILPVFALVATLCGAIFTVLALSNDNKTLLILGIAFIIIGVAYYPLSTYLRNRLRNKMVKYLELDKV